jgi:hypothetical protein
MSSTGSPYWTPTGGSAPRTPRFAGPVWRIPGAVVAWLLFTFSFTLMFLAAGVLGGLGGFCASGGPYVIETECPDIVLWALPAGFFGLFIAAALGWVFQRGFSAPVIIWGWPILFIGFSFQFFAMIPLGAVFVGILCGGLFLLMGLLPLLFELRAGPRRLVLGRTTVRDVPFTEKPDAKRTVYVFGRSDPAAMVAPTAGDWLLSLACSLGGIAAGLSLALLVLRSAA